MLILGLVLLAAAVVAGVAGVLGNRGPGHQVAGGFHAFGKVMHGSSGQLFSWGIVIGVVATVGLMLLLGGFRRDLRRRAGARRDGARTKQDAQDAQAAQEAQEAQEDRSAEQPTRTEGDDTASIQTHDREADPVDAETTSAGNDH